jgi:hypothetical protein
VSSLKVTLHVVEDEIGEFGNGDGGLQNGKKDNLKLS